MQEKHSEKAKSSLNGNCKQVKLILMIKIRKK